MSEALTGLAVYLAKDNLLSTAQLAQAQLTAKQVNLPLVSYLVQQTLLSSEAILACAAKHFALPIFDFIQFDDTYLRNPVIAPELICRYRAIPLRQHAHTLTLGIADPTDHTVASAISFQTGLSIQFQLIPENKLNELLEKYYRPNILYSQLETTLAKIPTIEEPTEQDEFTDEPVTDFVNKLILDAIQKNISDIHLEPYEKFCRIRFRRDGLLYEATRIPTHLATRVCLRLKIMAQLNISERRLPQDGRMKWREKIKKDIRINCCPTLFGEKIVLRILDATILHLDSHSLGMTTTQLSQFLTALKKPQGLILVTGPTGSGKTTTLYSAMHYLNQIEYNICSAEDPVEIEMPGINQIHINPKIGLNFSAALRAFLRQDPDVIMLGEIRDTETAQIAMQAAQTGHLVLSTLHTNNAVETIMRLRSMQIEAYQVINSISLIIAQRLVRKLCPLCKIFDPINQHYYHAVGCNHCHQGFHQRTGIFECIPMTENIAELIFSGAQQNALIKQLKQENGMMLYESGLAKVLSGETSYQELNRVVTV